MSGTRMGRGFKLWGLQDILSKCRENSARKEVRKRGDQKTLDQVSWVLKDAGQFPGLRVSNKVWVPPGLRFPST